jgi:hypothetical protein
VFRLHSLQVFIATAFTTCGSAMGWSVTTATVFHELAQEISDYVVLTQPSQANLPPLHALFLNLLSGTSVLFGTYAPVHSKCKPGVGGCTPSLIRIPCASAQSAARRAWWASCV